MTVTEKTSYQIPSDLQALAVVFAERDGLTTLPHQESLLHLLHRLKDVISTELNDLNFDRDLVIRLVYFYKAAAEAYKVAKCRKA